MLISQEYAEQNQALHQTRQDYGANGHRFAFPVRQLAEGFKAQVGRWPEILDYGCGKGTLAQHMPFDIRQYDPAVPKHAQVPEPAEIVVCADVLEHIEPDCLDAVLDDLKRVTISTGFFAIATRPAKKTLPDGRNTHLIIEPMEWWLAKLMERFTIQSLNNNPGAEFHVVVLAQ